MSENQTTEIRIKLDEAAGSVKISNEKFTYVFSRSHGYEGRMTGGGGTLDDLKKLASQLRNVIGGEAKSICELGFRDHGIKL